MQLVNLYFCWPKTHNAVHTTEVHGVAILQRSSAQSVFTALCIVLHFCNDTTTVHFPVNCMVLQICSAVKKLEIPGECMLLRFCNILISLK